MKRRVLVTGANGMLGSQLMRDVPASVEAVGTDLPDVDLAEPADVERLFAREGPFDAVIHCAAFTAVDLAEEKEAEAHRANAVAAGVVAEACARHGAALVMVSTDFVFDGRSDRPYRPDDATNPLAAYGRTKLAGEQAARAAHPDGTRIVRTQWLYGPRGRHFPGRIQELAAERDSLRVVADQIGSPTTTLELSPALWDVVTLDVEPGIYHAACEGEASWFDLAVATLEARGLTDVRVEPCTTDEYPTPAVRPAYSVLDCSRLTALRGRPLAPWREALTRYLECGEA